MTIINAISDLHGEFPEHVPPSDVFVVAGDICPATWPCTVKDMNRQERWLWNEFVPWLETIDAERKIVTAGNHDWIFQMRPEVVQAMPFTTLIDASVTACGLEFYGLPWQLRFHDWAFNLSEDSLAAKYANIPVTTDVLVSHGPAYGFGDLAERRTTWVYTGSPSLRYMVEQLKIPVVISGHIHEAAGVTWFDYEGGRTLMANVSMMNARYAITRGATVIEMDGRTVTTYLETSPWATSTRTD